MTISHKGCSILIAGIIVAEGVAWWWMSPEPSGLHEPVLVWRPKHGAGREASSGGRGTVGLEESMEAVEPSSEGAGRAAQDVVGGAGHESQSLAAVTRFVPLPDLVARSIPSLHCTAGNAALIEREDGVTIHAAFFEWDHASSANVLEAYRHLPDECLGSTGLTLTAYCPPRSYQVGGVSIYFDHTVFREPGGTVVQAFKGTWVSGTSTLLDGGLRGGAEQWRQLRLKAALKRFRPARARVVQGAVRGIVNPDSAWKAFEETVLSGLVFE